MISPTDLQNELSQSDVVLLIAAERDIDAALRKDFGNRPEIWIAIQPPWTPRICAALIGRYQAVGWRVRHHSDQRDGNALVFSCEAS